MAHFSQILHQQSYLQTILSNFSRKDYKNKEKNLIIFLIKNFLKYHKSS